MGRSGRLDILVNNALTRDGHVGGWGDVTATAEHTAQVAAGDFTGLFEMWRVHKQSAVACD